MLTYYVIFPKISPVSRVVQEIMVLAQGFMGATLR
jgi:hypothetical protein